MSRFQGNTIAEYCFIGVIVLVSVIGVITLLGDNLDEALEGLRDNMSDNISIAEAAKAARDQSDPTAGTKGLKSKVVCYSNGICLKVPDVTAAGNKVTVTAGANGGKLTKAYNRTLKALLRKLEADPNTDPQLLALMKKLVNSGYDLAKAEYDSLQWCNKKVCVKGKDTSKKVQRAADTGLDKTDAVYFAYMDYNDGMGGGVANEMKDYLASHPGALPPDLANLVNTMSGNITTIAKAFNPVDNFGSKQKGNTVEAGQDVKSTTALKDAPGSTKSSANVQCGTVSGCSPPGG